MFTQLIESAARFLVIEPIRDEALGDLWEVNHNLKQRGVSKFQRVTLIIWNFLLLIKASAVLGFERAIARFSRGAEGIAGEGEEMGGLPDGFTLTPEAIAQIRRYCNTRRLYTPLLSKKLMGRSEENSYWIRQSDRIIEKCMDRGDRSVDCESIINNFILSSLIRKVESFPPQNVDIEVLSDLIRAVDLTDEFIHRYVAFDDAGYNRQLIFRTWSLAVYVISWRPGQASWMHHHGYALDAIRVIRGKMTHWLVSADQFDGKVPFEGFSELKPYEGPSEVFSAGDIISIDRRQGHQIANLSDEELVTLHFRFGHPPEDDHWRSTNDAEMFVWNQTEGCFDLIRPHEGGCPSTR